MTNTFEALAMQGLEKSIQEWSMRDKVPSLASGFSLESDEINDIVEDAELNEPRQPATSMTDVVEGPPGFAFETINTSAIPRLLNANPFPRLVTVTAASGYGKTVLLSRVHKEYVRRGWRCIWLTLDRRHRDLSQLTFMLKTALEQTEPGSGNAVTLNSAPMRALAADPARTIIFIDNLGNCIDPELEQFLESLLFGAGLSLVLASTNAIPVDVVRAKLELSAQELQAKDLRFDRTSTAELFKNAGITNISDCNIDRIVVRTEGWPAAIRLLQVLLAPGSDSDRIPQPTDIVQWLDRFGGDHADIGRVLARRVLVGLEPELIQFMVEIALVQEFNAELAAYITSNGMARAWLQTLVSRNVLIFPVDSSQRWFRFHTLMREFLIAEAHERITSSRRREVLERVACWHRDSGNNILAIGYALDAASVEMAQNLLDTAAPVMVGGHGRMGMLIEWVDRLVQIGGQPSAEVHAWYVWALADSLQYERAMDALSKLERRVEDNPSMATPEMKSRLQVLHMLVNLFTDQLGIANEQALAWLAQGKHCDATTVSYVTSIAAIAEARRGDLSSASRRLDGVQASVDRSGSPYGKAWVGILRACIEIGRGRPDLASELLRTGRDEYVRQTGSDEGTATTIDFVHARALLDMGQASESQQMAMRGIKGALHRGIVASLEHGLIAAAANWRGAEEDEALTFQLNAAAHRHERRGPTLLAAIKIRRLLALEKYGDAQAEASRFGIGADQKNRPDCTSMHEQGECLLAGIELLAIQGGWKTVLDRVEPALKVARQQERVRDGVELLLIATDACLRLGRHRDALRHYSMAVTMATAGNLLQPFLSKKDLLPRLLAPKTRATLILVHPKQREFLERVKFLSTSTPAEIDSADGTMGDITGRQLEIIRLIADGFSNEEVAYRLSLSTATIKWHLHKAYTSLGVRSRSAALARLRTMNLLGI